MLEIFGIPITGWISSGGIIALVGLWFRRDIALRKLSSTEAGDLRDLYAKELAAVRTERAQDREEALKVEVHLRKMVEMSDKRHEECEEARQAMRKEMDEMHNEIAGLKRQIPVASADKLMVLDGRLPSEAAPHAAASAERIKNYAEGDK